MEGFRIPKEITKIVEVPMVVLEIEITKDFFDRLEKGRKSLAKVKDEDVLDYGEYIEQSMNQLVYIIKTATDKLEIEQVEEYIEENPKEDRMFG